MASDRLAAKGKRGMVRIRENCCKCIDSEETQSFLIYKVTMWGKTLQVSPTGGRPWPT